MARPKSALIREFIVNRVERHPADIGQVTASHYAITPEAADRHLTTLVEDELLAVEMVEGVSRYSLIIREYRWDLVVAENRDEDKVFREKIHPLLKDLPENIQSICYYGFTEMLNNVIDHSGSESTLIQLLLSAKQVKMLVLDLGVGVFEKIRSHFGIDNYRDTILELSKGKLTTSPSNHSGQGIFFSSKAFDEFSLYSNDWHFERSVYHDDYLLRTEKYSGIKGTLVSMAIGLGTDRVMRDVFDQYTNLEVDGYPFSKTHVVLLMALAPDEQFVSRSQAKRVVNRFEDFEEVTLDFKGIGEIGQAFADEVFRVFRNAHPEVKLVCINTNKYVAGMIRRADPGASIDR